MTSLSLLIAESGAVLYVYCPVVNAMLFSENTFIPAYLLPP